MLLPPGEGLAQKLPGFVKVKISGPQEAQYMLVLWDRSAAEKPEIEITYIYCMYMSVESNLHNSNLLQ